MLSICFDASFTHISDSLLQRRFLHASSASPKLVCAPCTLHPPLRRLQLELLPPATQTPPPSTVVVQLTSVDFPNKASSSASKPPSIVVVEFTADELSAAAGFSAGTSFCGLRRVYGRFGGGPPSGPSPSGFLLPEPVPSSVVAGSG